MTKIEQFEELSKNGGPKLPIDTMEPNYFRQFFICDKSTVKSITIPVFIIFIKTDDINNPSSYEYLHAQYVDHSKSQLKEFENNYFDESTHVLWYQYGNEQEDMTEQTSNVILQKLTSNSKIRDFYKWTYPLQNPYKS